MQRALESALAELTLGPEIRANDPVAIEAWLARHQVAAEDRGPLQRDFGRLLVYRRLVRGNLQSALESTIPRTVARLGAAFTPYFDAYLQATPPSTRYLRDVPRDFLAHALPRWQQDARVAPYLADLARHEALQIELASLRARPKAHVVAELDLEAPLEWIDAVRLVDYAFRVHELPEAVEDRSEPEQARVSLLAYRSPEHEVRYLELSPFARALLAALLREQLPLRAAIARSASELGRAADDGFLQATAALLAELAERGALLGRAPREPQIPDSSPIALEIAEPLTNAGKSSQESD